MIKYDYWNISSQKIVDKYVKLMKETRVVFHDIDIGYRCCYVYKTPELERRCTEATKIFNCLHKEIDKFPKQYRGIIYAALRKFKI